MLNPRNRATQIALSNLEILHAAVEAAVNRSEGSGRTLWRIDTLRGNLYLLIVSELEPKLDGIAEQFGFLEGEGETKNYDPFLRKIENGQVWRFKLTCNPTKAVKETPDPQRRGKICSVLKEKDQIEWLIKQGQKNGFTVRPETIRISNKNNYHFKKGKNKPYVQFLSISFEGVLVVENAALLTQALTAGIGREKAYGQGLLTLMRI